MNALAYFSGAYVEGFIRMESQESRSDMGVTLLSPDLTVTHVMKKMAFATNGTI
jgi:hypothetical protein